MIQHRARILMMLALRIVLSEGPAMGVFAEGNFPPRVEAYDPDPPTLYPEGEKPGGGGGGTQPLSVSLTWRGTLGHSLTTNNALHFTLSDRLRNIGPIEDRKLGLITPEQSAFGWYHRSEIVGTVSGTVPAGVQLTFRQLVSKLLDLTLDGGGVVTITLATNADDSPMPAFRQTTLTADHRIFMVDAPGLTLLTFPPEVDRVVGQQNFLTTVQRTDGAAITSQDVRWHQTQVFQILATGALSLVSHATTLGNHPDSRIPVEFPQPFLAGTGTGGEEEGTLESIVLARGPAFSSPGFLSTLAREGGAPWRLGVEALAHPDEGPSREGYAAITKWLDGHPQALERREAALVLVSLWRPQMGPPQLLRFLRIWGRLEVREVAPLWQANLAPLLHAGSSREGRPNPYSQALSLWERNRRLLLLEAGPTPLQAEVDRLLDDLWGLDSDRSAQALPALAAVVSGSSPERMVELTFVIVQAAGQFPDGSLARDSWGLQDQWAAARLLAQLKVSLPQVAQWEESLATQPLSRAVPAELAAHLKSWGARRSGGATLERLGLMVRETPASLGVSFGSSVLITHVMRKSPAAQAGFKVGWRLLALEGITLTGAADLVERVSGYAGGGWLQFTVLPPRKDTGAPASPHPVRVRLPP